MRTISKAFRRERGELRNELIRPLNYATSHKFVSPCRRLFGRSKVAGPDVVRLK